MSKHRIYSMSFASVYPHYVNKAEKKGRTKSDVDQIVRWLTGYSQAQLNKQIKREITFEEFFDEAPAMNPDRALVKGCLLYTSDAADD